MVGSLVGSKAAGIFDIAFKASILANFTQLVISWPLAPAVADLYTRADKKGLQRLVTNSARVGLFGALAIAFVYIVFGRWVLLVFGKEFTKGTGILTVLTMGQLISVVAGPVIPLLNMTGYEKKAAEWIALGTVVNATLGCFLTLSFGTMGAAVSNVLSTVTWNFFLCLLVRKKLGINTSPLAFIKRKW